MLKETERKNMVHENCRIRFIETSGRKYIDQLKVKDPFQSNCKPEDQKCFICSSTDKPSNCKTANIGYSIKCKNCETKGIKISYEGENAHIRGNEHMKALERKDDKSALYKHINKWSSRGKAAGTISNEGCWKVQNGNK